MITVVQLGLGALMLAYLGVFFQDVWKHRSEIHSDGPLKNFINVAQGYITNFLDTLGIGSFAPQTIIYKTFHLVKDDSNVPGTLNVANTIPVMFEGFTFLTIVEVEAFTLIVLIIASIIGGIAGAKVVSKLPVKKVQLVIATALALTAILMALRQSGMLDILGEGNTALGLSGIPLIASAIGLFFCGVGQSMGVGFYAPCMAIVYFAGMDPLVSFPIMMASCAAVMPMSSITYIKSGKYDKLMSILIMISGVFGVATAAYLVKSMEKDLLVWIIVGVVIIASITVFKQALTKENTSDMA